MPVVDQPRMRDHWIPVGRRETHQDYYMVRPVPEPKADYWIPKQDPDGRWRARRTEAERQRYLRAVTEELDFVHRLEPGNILDIGCGLGWFLRELPEWNRMGVETSDIARNEVSYYGISCSHYIDTVPPDWADVVFCHHVIEHVVDPIHLMTQVNERTRKGGWLVIGTPDFESPCAVRFGANYRMLHDQTHCSLFTRESMSRFLLDFGWSIEQIRFPFPEEMATAETFARWHDTTRVSPPWPGNWVTFYCRRPV